MSTTVESTGLDERTKEHDSVIEISGGEGNTSSQEVHIALTQSDGLVVMGWFWAAELVEAIERHRHGEE